jgi:hypothetical protein
MTPPRRLAPSGAEPLSSPAVGARGAGAEGLLDTHPGNQFRSNVEFYEKPRQLMVLGVMMGVMMYVAYAHEAATPVSAGPAAPPPPTRRSRVMMRFAPARTHAAHTHAHTHTHAPRCRASIRLWGWGGRLRVRREADVGV